MKKKVCAYAICKNELDFIDDWWKSISEADEVYVLDTGSTDGSAERLEALGAHVTRKVIDPWRFDRARNEAMALIPDDADICVSTDIDERFTPGWRQKLEAAWDSVYDCNQATYTYVFNQTVIDGKPQDGLTFTYQNIHARHGFRWECPCHEVIVADVPRITCNADIVLRHDYRPKERRTNYFDLLQLGVEEEPTDPRRRAYLAREYFYNRNYVRAIEEYKKSIELAGQFCWHEEKGLSLLQLAKCYAYTGNSDLGEFYGLKALAEIEGREPLMFLARLYYDQKRWWECRYYSEKALAIPYTPFHGREPECYGSYPPDLACQANYRLGYRDRAIEHARRCIELDPKNERYRNNAEYFGISVPQEISIETVSVPEPESEPPETEEDDEDDDGLVIVQACTPNWLDKLEVSLFTHLRANNVKRVYTYCDGDVTGITRLCNSFGAEHRNILLSESLAKYISPSSPNADPMCSKATLARLFIPCDIPDEHRVLYLDVDTVSHKPWDIWNIDMKGYAVAGGRDVAQIRDYRQEVETMKFGGQYDVINAGVLLMNLDFIRARKIECEWLRLINTVRFRLDDQDAINVAVGEFRYIYPARYNSSVSCGYVDDPVLTHFSAIGDFDTNTRWDVCELWRKAASDYHAWKAERFVHAD